MTVFIQSLSQSTAAAIELLGCTFGGIVVSDRFSAYNHLPLEQRQLCWAHLIRDLTAITYGLAATLNSERSCWACTNICLVTGTTTRRERLTGPPCSKAAGRSVWHLD